MKMVDGAYEITVPSERGKRELGLVDVFYWAHGRAPMDVQLQLDQLAYSRASAWGGTGAGGVEWRLDARQQRQIDLVLLGRIFRHLIEYDRRTKHVRTFAQWCAIRRRLWRRWRSRLQLRRMAAAPDHRPMGSGPDALAALATAAVRHSRLSLWDEPALGRLRRNGLVDNRMADDGPDDVLATTDEADADGPEPEPEPEPVLIDARIDSDGQLVSQTGDDGDQRRTATAEIVYAANELMPSDTRLHAGDAIPLAEYPRRRDRPLDFMCQRPWHACQARDARAV